MIIATFQKISKFTNNIIKLYIDKETFWHHFGNTKKLLHEKKRPSEDSAKLSDLNKMRELFRALEFKLFPFSNWIKPTSTIAKEPFLNSYIKFISNGIIIARLGALLIALKASLTSCSLERYEATQNHGKCVHVLRIRIYGKEDQCNAVIIWDIERLNKMVAL